MNKNHKFIGSPGMEASTLVDKNDVKVKVKKMHTLFVNTVYEVTHKIYFINFIETCLNIRNNEVERLLIFRKQ